MFTLKFVIEAFADRLDIEGGADLPRSVDNGDAAFFVVQCESDPAEFLNKGVCLLTAPGGVLAALYRPPDLTLTHCQHWVSASVAEQIKLALRQGRSVGAICHDLGVGSSTVQRIRREGVA